MPNVVVPTKQTTFGIAVCSRIYTTHRSVTKLRLLRTVKTSTWNYVCGARRTNKAMTPFCRVCPQYQCIFKYIRCRLIFCCCCCYCYGCECNAMNANHNADQMYAMFINWIRTKWNIVCTRIIRLNGNRRNDAQFDTQQGALVWNFRERIIHRKWDFLSGNVGMFVCFSGIHDDDMRKNWDWKWQWESLGMRKGRRRDFTIYSNFFSPPIIPRSDVMTQTWVTGQQVSVTWSQFNC